VRNGQGVLNIVPLGAVVDQIDAGVHELRPAESGDAAVAAPERRRSAAR